MTKDEAIKTTRDAIDWDFLPDSKRRELLDAAIEHILPKYAPDERVLLAEASAARTLLSSPK